jgi:hypothetical protein
MKGNYRITLFVFIIHFLLTSLIGHYIAVQIGTQMGQVVAENLADASKKNPEESEEEASRIYQKMKSKSEDVPDSWKVTELLISLPAKPLMSPLLKEMRQNLINRLIAKAITREQFRIRGLIIDYTANFLNSLSFGLLVFIMLKIFIQNKRR